MRADRDRAGQHTRGNKLREKTRELPLVWLHGEQEPKRKRLMPRVALRESSRERMVECARSAT